MMRLSALPGWALTAAILCALCVFVPATLLAGLNKELQNYYLEQYRNRALYLKIPVHGFRQVVQVGPKPSLDRSTLGQPLAFKVGEQVRITEINFKNDFIRFKIAAVDLSRESEILFQFPASITDEFSEGRDFDAALAYSFTEGTNYREIDSAKESFIADQFDQLIEQFAKTTGTSRDYVIQTISEKNPAFEQNKRRLAEKERELAGLRQQLDEEAARRRASERDLSRLRSQVSSAESDADSLKAERMQLLDERDDLRARVRQLEEQNQKALNQRRDSETRIGRLLQSLSVETTSNTELATQLTTLGQAIESLKGEKEKLARELQDDRQKLADSEAEKRQQLARLQRLEAEKRTLTADLRELTTDKNGLNSRFLESRKRGDALEAALALASGLTVKHLSGSRQGPWASEVFLLDRKLGTLRVEKPSLQPFKVSFEMVSPDTVEFSDRERELWGRLGGQTNIRAAWIAETPGLKPALTGGEALQRVAPREAAEWTFQLASMPAAPSPVRLQLTFFDPDGREIPVSGLDYEVQPNGLGSLLQIEFSWLSLALGLVAGGALVALAGLARRRSAAPSPRDSAGMSAKRL